MTDIEQLQARIKELESECARCQMLEVKIEQLQKLMQGWGDTEDAERGKND